MIRKISNLNPVPQSTRLLPKVITFVPKPEVKNTCRKKCKDCKAKLKSNRFIYCSDCSSIRRKETMERVRQRVIDFNKTRIKLCKCCESVTLENIKHWYCLDCKKKLQQERSRKAWLKKAKKRRTCTECTRIIIKKRASYCYNCSKRVQKRQMSEHYRKNEDIKNKRLSDIKKRNELNDK